MSRRGNGCFRIRDRNSVGLSATILISAIKPTVRERVLPNENEELDVKAEAREVREEGKPLQCPRCGAERIKRMRREGFFKRKICSAFGYYPWRCTKCLGNFLLKKRALRRTHLVPEQVAETSGAPE